jgi:hypothetical protein
MRPLGVGGSTLRKSAIAIFLLVFLLSEADLPLLHEWLNRPQLV